MLHCLSKLIYIARKTGHVKMQTADRADHADCADWEFFN